MSDNARDSSSAKQSGGHYPEVDPQPNFPALEREILEVWRRDETFRRSVEFRPADDPSQPGDMRDTHADSAAAENELGFRSTVSLDDGLAREWEWLRGRS